MLLFSIKTVRDKNTEKAQIRIGEERGLRLGLVRLFTTIQMIQEYSSNNRLHTDRYLGPLAR